MSDFLQNLTAIVEEASLLTTSLDDENNDKTENTQDSENSQKIDNGVEIHIHEETEVPDLDNISPPEPDNEYLAPDPDIVRRVSGRRRMSLSGVSQTSQWKASGSQSSLTDVL